jgi:uncharacterized repeat protein (TIGR02543 family)
MSSIFPSHCQASFFIALLMATFPGSVGVANPTAHWTTPYLTGGTIFSSPAIATDGTVYIGSNDNKLHAINSDGSAKWTFTTGDWVDSTPAIGADGTIYFGSWDNQLYAINPMDGSKFWDFNTSSSIIASPAIGVEGRIYFGSKDEFFYALESNGSLAWETYIGNAITSSAAIGQDGTIYFGDENGTFHALNQDGSTKWTYEVDDVTDTNKSILSSPAIDLSGNLYFGCGNGYCYSIADGVSAGVLNWKVGTNDRVDASPVLGENNEVFFVSRDGYLRSVDRVTGISNWEVFSGDVFYSSPVVDSNGKVYVIGYTGFGENHLFAFNSDGTKSWDTNNSSSPLSIGGLVDSSLALDSSGNLFFGCYDKKVYAVNVGAGLADNSWPQFQRNNKRSGAWPSFTISVIIEPNGAGEVSGVGIYNPGATATLNVTSNTGDGYNFESWSNGQTGSSNPLVLQVTSDLTLTANFGLLAHNLVVNAGTGGTAIGSGNIPHGTLKTITATPSTGYSFTGWSGTGITDSSSATTTVNMTLARTVTANFELNSYPLTVNTTTGGTVTGSGNIPHGTLSVVSATPNDGYSFTVWSGNGISDPYSPLTTVNMNQARTIKAHFSLNSYVLSLVSNEGGTTTGEGNFSYGSNASILATPSAGYSFSEWTGDGITNPFSASTTVSMEQNREISARFVPIYYSLSVNSSIGGIANGEGNFSHGSNASIIATPANGYSFTGWTGEGISNSSANSTIVNMTQSRTVIANFAINSYTLTLNSEENGTVDGGGQFTYNSLAPIHALPDPGFIFLNWHGDGVTDRNQSSTTILMNQNRNLTASFTQVSEVSNYLNIRSQPINGGITSGTGNYTANENASISASPLPGFSFYSWSGDGVTEPLSQTTSVLMSVDRNITAQFSQNYYNLFLTSGEGGTALGSGAFTYGINTVITATPALGYSFDKWKGLGIYSPNSATTTVEMTENLSVSALFSINSYNLTINPTTGGSVEGSGSHSFGSNPTIVANPMEGYSFSSWSGEGVTNPTSQITSVQMSQDRNISASFSINSYDLTIQSSAGGAASGAGSFTFGSTPSISAIPMEGYSFSSWSGEGVTNPTSQITSVQMSQDRNISASFTKLLFSSILVTTELGNGWFSNNWLGSFYQSEIWWCYHIGLGWIYPASVTENSLWIWSPGMGWLWIDAERYLDSFAWSANEENWLYFNFESTSILRFYSYNNSRWTTYSQIQNLKY